MHHFARQCRRREGHTFIISLQRFSSRTDSDTRKNRAATAAARISGKPFRDAVYETMGKERLQSTGITPEKLREEISKRTKNEAYIRFATKVLTTPRDEHLIRDRQLILMEKMAQMEDQLSDGRAWLCGDQFTFADIALAPRVDMFPIVEVADLSARFPNIGKFMERIKTRPSWAGSAVRPEPGETERMIEPRAA